MRSLTCRCAAAAKAKGYTVFGLQFYGECYSGKLGETSYNKYGPSKKCYQQLANPPPPCDKKKAHECVGGPWVNYVYKVVTSKTCFPIETWIF